MAIVYPAYREADVALRDGSTIHVRPIRPGDRGALLAFLKGLSVQSRSFRFFSAAVNYGWLADRAVDVDYHDRYGLVSTMGAAGRIVGHAMYALLRPGRAESAFAVADELQGHGLGTILLAHLAQAAHDAGVDVLVNDVLPENHRMIGVFRDSGFAVATSAKPGYVRIEVPTSLSPEAIARFEDRDRIAAVAAMQAFLRPRSVAVIGASRRRGTIGGEIFHNLASSGFAGSLYAVNPNARAVEGHESHRSIADVPGRVDLAVIAVHASIVVDIARECGARGVRALIVVSSGFAEAGSDGANRQRELLAVCRETGMRLLGPNCMGVINTDPTAALNATFSSVAPQPGSVGLLSQSGALGVAMLNRAARVGLGLSSFVSMGNKADLSGNDVLQAWEQDERTSIAMLYLESFGNPRRFVSIARRVGRTKPIVVVKSGRTVAGARATTSHTGVLVASSDVTVDALFRASGVIRADTISEMLDVATVLAAQPLPAGDRVGIVTNGGGPAALCVDACESHGLRVPEFSPDLKKVLSRAAAGATTFDNPVDLTALGTPSQYRAVIEALAASGEVDVIVAISAAVVAAEDDEVVHSIADETARPPVPVVAVLMNTRTWPGAHGSVPIFEFPEDAARAVAHAVRYSSWRSTVTAQLATPEGIEPDRATAAIARALGRGPGWLAPGEIRELMECYGLPLAASRVVRTVRQAVDAADALRGPVALKAMSPGLVGKSKLGGVALGVLGEQEIVREAARIRRRLRGHGYPVDGFVVQRMVSGGGEILIGLTNDPSFGPIMAVGPAGAPDATAARAVVRIVPLMDVDAVEMVDAVAGFVSGESDVTPDRGALTDLVARVSALADRHPEIVEMDLHPVRILQRGATVLDAQVRVDPPAPRRPLLARRA